MKVAILIAALVAAAAAGPLPDTLGGGAAILEHKTHFASNPNSATQYRVYDTFSNSDYWITEAMTTTSENDCYNQCASEANCTAFVRYREVKATGYWKCRTLTSVGFEVHTNDFRSGSYRMIDRACPALLGVKRACCSTALYDTADEEYTILEQDLARCSMDGFNDITINYAQLPSLPANMFNETTTWTVTIVRINNQNFGSADIHPDAFKLMSSLWWIDMDDGVFDTLPSGIWQYNSNLMRAQVKNNANFVSWPVDIIELDAENTAFRVLDISVGVQPDCTDAGVAAFYDFLEWNVTKVYANPPIIAHVYDNEACPSLGRYDNSWWPVSTAAP